MQVTPGAGKFSRLARKIAVAGRTLLRLDTVAVDRLPGTGGRAATSDATGANRNTA